MPLLQPTDKPRVILGLMYVLCMQLYTLKLPTEEDRTFGPDVESGARMTSLKDFNKVLDIFQSQGYNEVQQAVFKSLSRP